MSDELNTDLIGQEADAKEAFSAKSFFGKMKVTTQRYIHWVDNQPLEVSQEEFVTLPTRDRSLELLFEVDIKEFRPDFEYNYQRKVRIGDSDWWKTVRPSIEALFGEGSMSKGKYGDTIAKLNGQYVEVCDVPQQKKPEYGTVSVTRLFKNKAECQTAWHERFGSGATTSNSGVPDGWDASVWNEFLPEIKNAIASGTPPAEIATNYGLKVSDVLEVKKQM